MITTGKIIYDLLRSNTDITNMVADKIFPLVIPEGTNLPCIVYSREFENNHTKDYYTSSNCTVNITIISEKYQEGIDIQYAVNNTLKDHYSSNVKNISLMNGNETYVEGQFIQSLNFTVKTV